MSIIIRKILINASRMNIRSINYIPKYVDRSINSTCFNSKRFISFSSIVTEEKLKIIDKIPGGYELIYRSTMNKYLLMGQVCVAISIIGVGISLLINDVDYEEFVENKMIRSMADHNSEFIIFGSALILFNVAILFLILKFPIRLYHNSTLKHYIGVSYSVLPTLTRKFDFKLGNIRKLESSNTMLPWNDNKFKLKSGKVIILFDHYFRKPQDMNNLLGY